MRNEIWEIYALLEKIFALLDLGPTLDLRLANRIKLFLRMFAGHFV